MSVIKRQFVFDDIYKGLSITLDNKYFVNIQEIEIINSQYYEVPLIAYVLKIQFYATLIKLSKFNLRIIILVTEMMGKY